MRKLNFTKLGNQVLKVVVPKIDPPYVNFLNCTHEYEQEIGYGPGPGIVWQLLREMADSLNLTYDLESMEHEGWGQKGPTGKWNGALGRLAEGSAEILVGGSIMTADRFDIADYTTPIAYQESAVLIRVPDRKDYVAHIFMKAFGWKVWLTLFASLAVSCLALLFIHHHSRTFPSHRANSAPSGHCFGWFPSSFWTFLALFSRRGILFFPPLFHCSSLVLLITLLFCSLFLMSHFYAILVPLFAFSTSTLPFITLEELLRSVQQGEWTLVLDKTRTGRTQLLEGVIADPMVHSSVFQDRERVVFVDGLIDGIHFVQTFPGRAMMIAPAMPLRSMASIECNVIVLPNTVLPAYMSIALRKGSPYRQYLNRRIPQFWQNGQILRWTKNFNFHETVRHRLNETKCEETGDDRLRKGILGFAHLAAIFLLLAVGLFACFAVFLAELALQMAQQRGWPPNSLHKTS